MRLPASYPSKSGDCAILFPRRQIPAIPEGIRRRQISVAAGDRPARRKTQYESASTRALMTGNGIIGSAANPSP